MTAEARQDTPNGPTPRRPGRPRDARADQVILSAATCVLGDLGPAGFTVDAVASRAGVGKATIYRRWPSRSELLVAAAQEAAVEIVDPDTGSLREDLVRHLTAFGASMQDTHTGRLLRAVLAEASCNPEVRELLGRLVNERRQLAHRILGRGVERGELPPGTDIELLLDTLAGPVFMRLLFTQGSLDRPAVEQIVDHALRGVAVA